MKRLLILLAFICVGCGAGVRIDADEIERWCPQIQASGYYSYGHEWRVSYDSTGTLVLTCSRCGFVSGTAKSQAKP